MFLRKTEEANPDGVGKTADWIQPFLQKRTAIGQAKKRCCGAVRGKEQTPTGSREGLRPHPIQAVSPLTLAVGAVYQGQLAK